MEEEELEAELMAASAWAGVVGDDGIVHDLFATAASPPVVFPASPAVPLQQRPRQELPGELMGLRDTLLSPLPLCLLASVREAAAPPRPWSPASLR